MQIIQYTPIKSEETRALRHLILRPDQPLRECVYPLDDMPDTGHYGAWEGDQLVGVASVFRESIPGSVSGHEWRIRGMAVLEDYRGKSIGKSLLEECLHHVRKYGGLSVWCNARTTAEAFYLGVGFSRSGDVFEIEGIGPHYLMQFAV